MDMPYRRLVSVAGWNRPVTVEDTHHAFRGLPEFAGWSKTRHYRAAVSAAYTSEHLRREYDRMVMAALDAHGDGTGVLISGIVRDHFPELVKATLRIFAHDGPQWADRSLAHWQAAGKRRETWLMLRDTIRRQFDTL